MQSPSAASAGLSQADAAVVGGHRVVGPELAACSWSSRDASSLEQELVLEHAAGRDHHVEP